MDRCLSKHHPSGLASFTVYAYLSAWLAVVLVVGQQARVAAQQQPQLVYQRDGDPPRIDARSMHEYRHLQGLKPALMLRPTFALLQHPSCKLTQLWHSALWCKQCVQAGTQRQVHRGINTCHLCTTTTLQLQTCGRKSCICLHATCPGPHACIAAAQSIARAAGASHARDTSSRVYMQCTTPSTSAGRAPTSCRRRTRRSTRRGRTTGNPRRGGRRARGPRWCS